MITSILLAYILLVSPVTCDAGVVFQSGITYKALTTEELDIFQTCLCNTANDWYHFDTSENLTLLNFTSAASDVQYTDIYNCSIQPVYIQCTRIKQSNLGSTFLNKGSSSFSLTNVPSCDLDCVSVVWGSQNVTTNITDERARYGVCSPEVRELNTKPAPPVIIVAVIIGTVITITLIAAVIYVVIKRKGQKKTTVVYTVPSDTSKVPDMSVPQEHMYALCNGSNTSLSETTEQTSPEAKNIYARLHEVKVNQLSPYSTLQEIQEGSLYTRKP